MVWMIAKEENTNYLCHHGIKGQKWGVRRYQNEDGSYTEEGKKRRSNSANKNTLLTSKDFKMKDSILEYIGPNDEYTAIADPERLEWKYGVSTEDAIKRINKIRTNSKIIEDTKKATLEHYKKTGGVYGVNSPALEFAGININRDNIAEIGFYLNDKNSGKFHGIFSAAMQDDDRTPAYFDYLR